MEEKGLNIVQLKSAIRARINMYEEMLKGEIRIIGLRKKVEARLSTLKVMLKITRKHIDEHE